MTMTPEEKGEKILELLEERSKAENRMHKIRYLTGEDYKQRIGYDTDPEYCALRDQLPEIDRQLTELAGNGDALSVVREWVSLELRRRLRHPGPIGWSVQDWEDIETRQKVNDRLKTEFGIELKPMTYPCPLCGEPAFNRRGHLAGMCPQPKVY